MARQTRRLSARSVATLQKAGRHSDGDGLYLIIDNSGAKRWAFLFRWKESGQQPGPGKLREMGLGGVSAVSLADAREKAAAARQALASGRNPIEERKAAEAARRAPTTFGSFADELVEDLKHGFRSEVHKAQWSRSLARHAGQLRAMPLDKIETADVLAVLAPIWKMRNETASRVRGRIERILDAAKAKGLRFGENPARWRGHLDKLLPGRRKLAKGHFAALPYPDVPALFAELRTRGAVTARALEFCILNVNRTSEVLGARWNEIDRKARVWTIPRERMKGGREHRIPLSSRALEILDTVEPLQTGDYIFPGKKAGRPLSPSTLKAFLAGLKTGDATVHGFRSSFREWAGEATTFPRELAEAALAHVVGDETERAYRRGDALEKRRKLMDAWAGFLANEKAGGKVVPIRREKQAV